MYKFLREKNFEKNTTATLQWLEQSIQVTDYQGSAAYCHLWKGWSPAYPETTGYIIETLFNYAIYFNKEQYRKLAIACADWLCTIQNADGSFPGGVGINGEPVVFDTGQILFGLTRAFQETQHAKYKIALTKAVEWLLEILESDGSWRQFAYVTGYVPAYYTRVVWAVLQANKILNVASVETKMRQALDFYVAKVTPQYSVKDWGFSPGESAYTHTIAYTMRGFLESGYLLQQENLIQIARNMADRVIQMYESTGKLGGRYDENWRGDYSFICVTGNAQLSLVFSRLYQLTDDFKYRDYALKFFHSVFSYQWRMPGKQFYGAIPGSFPIWGVYQRFRFPNWAAKFYLDAYLQLYQISK